MKMYLHAFAFHAIPELLHFRWHGTSRKGLFHRAVRVGEAQQIVKVDANPEARIRTILNLLREALGLVENV